MGAVKAVLVHPGYLEREINDVLNQNQDLETWIERHALLGMHTPPLLNEGYWVGYDDLIDVWL